LVDEATWSACERRRLAGKRVRLSGTRRTSSYLLSGVLMCPRCEATMTGEQRPADRSHEVRNHYLCSRRRIEGKAVCDQPYLTQERLETDLLEVLKAIALPEGVAAAVDAAVAEMHSGQGRKSRQVSLKTLEGRQARLNEDWMHVTIEELKRLVASIFEVITLTPDQRFSTARRGRVGRPTSGQSFLRQSPMNHPRLRGVLSGRRDSNPRPQPWPDDR
jgi:hypothetical protein